jgi:hypothetical protein
MFIVLCRMNAAYIMLRHVMLCYKIHFCNILPSILSISNWSFYRLFSTWKFVASYECHRTHTTHLLLSPECHLMSSTAKMMCEILLSIFSVLNIPLHSCSKIPPVVFFTQVHKSRFALIKETQN